MLNAKDFNFQMFFGGKEIVKSLKDGALRNGGATKYDNEIISNIETDDFIKVNNSNNEVSIFVPSTLDVSSEIDNTSYVKGVIQRLRDRYSLQSMKFYNTHGSWHSSNDNIVVIEKITIVTVKLEEVNSSDIQYFVNIAEQLKSDMRQDGISVSINECLAII